MTNDPTSSRMRLPLALLAGLAVLVCVTLVAYRPNRPVATIVPGSSAGPAFVVQIIRPRLGLPLGGILPPQLFELVFEERQRRVRCRPGDPAIGKFSTTALAEPGEFSGSFDIELARCEDANTGKPLGWPPKPLRLHGSFDRLPLDAASKGR